jgi:hypothetical protein
MGWPVYSETFVRTLASGVSVSYTVPPGKRAVVKHCSTVNYGQVSGAAIITVGGISVGFFALQATTFDVQRPGMWVAYAGQKIEVYHQVVGFHTTVSGFLFDVPTLVGRRPPPALEEPLPGDMAEPVPVL